MPSLVYVENFVHLFHLARWPSIFLIVSRTCCLLTIQTGFQYGHANIISLLIVVIAGGARERGTLGF